VLNAGVIPFSQQVTVVAEALPERSVLNAGEMPFGVGGYTNTGDVPEKVTVCASKENLYRFSDDTYTIIYSVPYGRTIRNIHDKLSNGDGNVFYLVDYTEYVSSNSETLYLYGADVVENTEYCPDQQNFIDSKGVRNCESIYPDTDMEYLSDELCLHLAIASDMDWVGGYQGKKVTDSGQEFDATGMFLPYAVLDYAEISKIVINTLGIADDYTYDMSSSLFADDIFSPTNEKPWFANYMYAMYEEGFLSTDSDGNIDPGGKVTFDDAVRIAMQMFGYDIHNPCDFDAIYPNPILGAALFFGVIEQEAVTYTEARRAYFVHMMYNAWVQQSDFHSAFVCPDQPEPNRFNEEPQLEEKQICATDVPVKLSSTNALELDGTQLLNGTKVTLNDDGSVSVNNTGETGYVAESALVEYCTIPTPLDKLTEPQSGQVVVATPVGIMLHAQPSVASAIVAQLPYNAVLTALDNPAPIGNWLYVQTNDGQEGWVYRGFLSESETGVPTVAANIPKKIRIIDWAYDMTVDFRMKPEPTRNTILWETYEGVQVQLIESHASLPLSYVSIDFTDKQLSAGTIEANYGR